LIDLAPQLDDEALEAAFESGRRMGLTTVTLLARRANELCGKGRPGSGRVRRLLSVAEARATESRLEVKFARLVRASALPKPVRQYAVGAYRLDFAWPWLWVAAECDGFERHGTRLAWKRDRARIAAIEHAGWRIVHFTWDDITSAPTRSVERVALALCAAA
jgi:very-short-patch-repair endonuclease